MDRDNHALQAVIDECIVLYDAGARAQALACLKRHAVPAEVAERVLRCPERRRRYINDFLSGF